MKKDKVIRVYELSEVTAEMNQYIVCDNNGFSHIEKIEKNSDQKQFVLKEYLEVDENRVSTGRIFQTIGLVKMINRAIAETKIKGTVYFHGQTGSLIGQFSLGEKGNLKVDKFSNVETKEIKVVMSKDITNNNLLNPQIEYLEKALVHAARRANRLDDCKLERNNRFEKAVGIASITVATIAVIGGLVAASPAFISALQEKQAMQRQKEIEMLKQQGPSISELQQQDDYDQLDTWDTYLKQKVEEQKEQRKLP